MDNNSTFLPVGALALAALLAASPASTLAEEDPSCVAGASPLLSVADFDADGMVTRRDLTLIARALARGEYVAFYDRNADGRLTGKDAELAARDLGHASTPMDRDIARVFWATEGYRDLGKAALEGYEPTTQPVAGHGRHWLQLAAMEAAAYPAEPRLTHPAGLNYDEQGRLQAVFWGRPTPYPASDYPTPALFSEPQEWHFHDHACVIDFGLIESVRYRDGVPPSACRAAGGRSSNFQMLHLWLYRLNPNGPFSMTHPCA